ncbi:MAG: hypothetical protein HOP30_08910 [Cyclobacteriaceae bacterium]|nr:hypothetical protein [Cyclobacteriaceae bacterium]
MTFAKAIRLLAFAMLFFMAGASFAQNTKGDKPAKPLPRITLKSKPGKSKTVKSKTRDISGRRLRTKNKSSAARAVVSTRSVSNARWSRGSERAGTPIGGNRIKIRSSSAKMARNNVYPNKGPYVNNPSRRPRKSERAFKDAAPIGQPVLYSTRSNASPYPKKRKIIPRSGSRSFITRGRKNVYWGKFSKGEKAYTKDITGRPLRTKNFRTPPVEVLPQSDPYQGRKRNGEKGRSALGKIFNSTPKAKQKAWNGDVSGKGLRRNSSKRNAQSVGKFFMPRKFSVSGKRAESVGQFFMPRKYSVSGKKRGPGRPVKGSGYQTMGGRGRNNKPLAVRIPKGGAGVANYRGSYKQSVSAGGGGYSGGGGRGIKPIKGGGSISGSPRNNRGNPVPAKIPSGGGRIGSFSGNVKRKLGFTTQGSAYRGGIKTKRPFKGGGSISGQSRNNGNQSVSTKIPKRPSAARAGTYQGNIKKWDISPGFTPQGAGYKGSIKGRRPEKGGGSISGQSRNNRGNSVGAKIPPSFASKAGRFSGNMKGRRPQKGGGSISGQPRNNGGNSVGAKIPPSFAARSGRFSGSMKAKRPQKGGGSISGQPRNNDGNSVGAKIPPSFAARAGRFSGSIKAKRPQKGGGSISGQPRNNGGYPVAAKIPPAFAGRAGKYTGTMKAKRPQKGGGSISGQPRNNDGVPVAAKIPPSFAGKMGKYTGSMKAKRPKKGGGSISGQPRNNDGNPVAAKIPPTFAGKIEKYKGSLRARKPEKGGGSVSGQPLNNDGKPVKVREKKLVDLANARYTGFLKRPTYVKGPNANKLATRQEKPNKSTFRVGGLQVRVKEADHQHNKLSAKKAIDGKSPGKGSVRASEFEGKMKQIWSYKHNPSSAKKALQVKDPGRAYARINNYQGNLRMSKPHGSRLHPDAKFAHGHIDNVKKERTILVNVKLLWSKLFKKSDNQPTAVKEKVRKPRYDKKERELWKDLYD